MTSLLRAVLLKHEEELSFYLKSNKYQYCVSTMTLENPVSGGLSAVRVDDVLEQLKTDLVF